MPKEKNKNLEQLSNISRTIKARVFDINNGLTEYDDVILVRVKSHNNNQLIMADHLALLTKVDESVVIVTKSGEYPYLDLTGYCLFKEGIFTLMIEDKYSVTR